MDKQKKELNYKLGSLPGKAPLAMTYVPLQDSASPSYESIEALSRGTLFPGLDLPLMNIVNDNMDVCPLTELMAIDFAADELELYLDTHCDDAEAFAMYQTFLALKKEARSRYEQQYGPISQEDMLGAKCYDWLKEPWPWEYRNKAEV